MHATAHAGIHWVPTSEAERAMVLRQMDRLLKSRHFCNSKRYPVLLEYLIRETLAGNSHSLKERVLGITVFHRPPDYDANADPVVRVTAAEIRRRIAQFYQEKGASEEIYIALRPGSYVPEFCPISSGLNEFRGPVSLPAETPAATLALAAGKPKWIRWTRRSAFLFAAASGLIVLSLLALALHRHLQNDQRSQMWRPLLDSPAPVLLVVGQPH